MTHIRQEIAFGSTGRFGRVLGELQLVLSPLAHRHVPEQRLDAGDVTIHIDNRCLQDVDVEIFSLGTAVTFDIFEHMPGISDRTVVSSILFGKLRREEVIVGAADNLF